MSAGDATKTLSPRNSMTVLMSLIFPSRSAYGYLDHAIMVSVF
jgi:hypothetical protein